MFESNADFEFDDEIFSVPFDDTTTPAPLKRAIEPQDDSNNTTSNKKLCSDTRIHNPMRQTSSNSSKLNERSFPNNNSPKLELRLSNMPTAVLNSPRQRIVLRKFPGPAGLLPERKDLNIDVKTLEETDKRPKDSCDGAADIDLFCSQMSVQAFQEGPWLKMSKDFQPRGNGLYLPDKYNVAWIKSKAKANKLINQKAPFLAAVIQSVECLNLKTAIVTVLLKDATGQIQGTIVHDLFDEHVKVLTVGSVVVLKQVGVLTTDNGTNHYLTITANNLVRVYSSEPGTDARMTPIQRFTVDDLQRNINETRSNHRVVLFQRKSNEDIDFEEVLLKLRATSNSSTNISPNTSSANWTLNKIEQKSDVNKIVPPFTKSAISEQPRVILSTASDNFNKENVNSSGRSSKFNFKPFNKQSEVETSFLAVINQTNRDENANKNSYDFVSDVKCSQRSVGSDNSDNAAILQNIFEGLDTDSLFEDF